MRTLIITLALFGLNSVAAQVDMGDVILKVDPKTNCEYRYFYYPNIEAYYDAKKNLYLYKDNDGVWAKAKEIPSGYRGYSLQNKINVVIDDYDGDDPIQLLPIHKKKYPYNFHKKQRVVAEY